MKRQASDTHSDFEPRPPDGSGSATGVNDAEIPSKQNHDSKKAKLAHSTGSTGTREKPTSPVEKTVSITGEDTGPVSSVEAGNPGLNSGQTQGRDTKKNIDGLHEAHELRMPDFSTPYSLEEAGPISYAEAVLAGLPPDDEAVQMANLAKQSGKTLDDLVEFCYVSSSGMGETSTIVTDPLTGKSVALEEGSGGQDAFDGNLYKDMHGWCDSRNIEEQLRVAKEVRMKGLPKQGWKKKNKQKNKG